MDSIDTLSFSSLNMNQQPRLGFMSFALELRRKIYRHIIPDLDQSCYAITLAWSPHKLGEEDREALKTVSAMLRTSKTVYQELLKEWFRSSWVAIYVGSDFITIFSKSYDLPKGYQPWWCYRPKTVTFPSFMRHLRKVHLMLMFRPIDVDYKRQRHHAVEALADYFMKEEVDIKQIEITLNVSNTYFNRHIMYREGSDTPENGLHNNLGPLLKLNGVHVDTWVIEIDFTVNFERCSKTRAVKMLDEFEALARAYINEINAGAVGEPIMLPLRLNYNKGWVALQAMLDEKQRRAIAKSEMRPTVEIPVSEVFD